MTLRVKLIAAFVLLAVVPLAVLTLFSYASSVRAFEATVQRESERATQEMAARMAGVTAEVDRRLGRVGELPYARFAELDRLRRQENAATGAETPPPDDEADDFVAGLLREMGGTARLVERVEFVPGKAPAAAAAEAGPAGTPRPPAPPPPGPVVVQLDRLWAPDGRTPGAPHIEIERRGDVTILRPRGLDRAIDEAMGPEAADVPGMEWVQHFMDTFEVRLELDDPEAQAALEQAAAEIADGIEASRRDMAERAVEHVRGLVAVEEPVRRDGEVVGHLRATMDASQVLRAVLQRARREQGEIPFAIGGDGELFTLDDDARATLAELGVDPGIGVTGGPRRLAGNWVVITRENPETGIVFGLARPVGDSLDEIRRATGTNLAWGLGVVGLAMLGIVPLSNRMTRHVTELSAGVDRLAGGDWSARVDVRSRDEIGRLGRAFNNMAGQLDEQRRRLVTQERLRKELEMCRQIQEDLLPERRCRMALAELQAVSMPARELGGDFFNYFPLPDGSIALLMGDVSGKGVPAALLMANLQATLRARLPVQPDLARLADELDREIEASTPAESYLTLFVAVLAADGSRLRFVNAGHNTQYLRRADGRIERLVSSGRPLGLLSGGGYVEQSLDAGPGDLLCLFTDGLTEAPNPAGEEFGAARLEALLRDAVDRAPAAIVTAIESAVAGHQAGAEPADDATMLIVRLVEPGATPA